MAFARKYRLEQARTLLETDLPLRLIAERLGYCDHAHLNRAYRQTYGAPPGSIRGPSIRKSPGPSWALFRAPGVTRCRPIPHERAQVCRGAGGRSWGSHPHSTRYRSVKSGSPGSIPIGIVTAAEEALRPEER